MTRLLSSLFSKLAVSFTRPRRTQAVSTRSRLQVEELEARRLMSADWFSTNLPSPLVANLARNDWYNHYSVNYNDMLQIYYTIEQNGPVNAQEFASLQFLAQYGYTLNTPSSECFLEGQVVNGSPTNARYQGYSLGNLYVGSPSWQLNELVDKWFLGMDRPAAATAYSNIVTGTNGNPFGSNGPSYLDVHQGVAGDCWLLSSLAVTAARQPSVIKSMFTYDGYAMENGSAVGIWQVRFYHNGTPVYVTVDSELPSGGGEYDHPANGSEWVALAEKAYAEANAAGLVTTGTEYSNSYTALNGGDPKWALAAITGQSASDYAVNPTNLAAAWQQGDLIVLTTGSTTACSLIVPGHCYAVVAYNPSSSMPFEVYNPWGTDSTGTALGTYQGHTVYGLFYATGWFLADNFGWQTFAAASDMTAFVPTSAGSQTPGTTETLHRHPLHETAGSDHANLGQPSMAKHLSAAELEAVFAVDALAM